MSRNEKRPALACLQFGRALAACSVVLFHTAVIVASPKYWGARPVGHVFNQGSCGVFFFFALSGYIITIAHRNDIGIPARLRRYFSNRFTRIYPIYWLVSLIPLFYLILGSGLSVNSPSFYVGATTLFPIAGDVGLLAVAWTLFHEVIFYLVFATLIASRRFGAVVMSLWFIGCAACLFVPVNSDFLRVVFAPVNLLFLFGMVAALDSCILSARQSDALLFCGLVLFAAAWVFFTYNDYDAVRALGYGIPSAMIIYGAVAREMRGAMFLPRFGVWLGNASYSIYLVHYLVVSLLAKMLFPLAWSPASVAMGLLAAFGIGAGAGLYVLAERPLLRFARSRNPARF